MTITLKRNNVTPQASSAPLFSRFAQAAAAFNAPQKSSLPVQYSPMSVPEEPKTTPAERFTASSVIDEAAEAVMNAPLGSASFPQLSQLNMPTRPVWRAWRERDAETGTMLLRVVGLCPSNGINGRVVLQESVMAEQGNHWGGEGAKSGLLVLERLQVPPALGETDRPTVNPQQVRVVAYPWCYPWEKDESAQAPQPVLITFRKEESAHRPMQPRTVGIGTSAPRYTHVTILPDGITVPIQE